jgi:hypothetical protein
MICGMGVAMEVLEPHHDLEQVRSLLGHARIDTTQIYTTIRPAQLKRAVCNQRRRYAARAATSPGPCGLNYGSRPEPESFLSDPTQMVLLKNKEPAPFRTR